MGTIVGKDGADGKDGVDGEDGIDGKDGKSAYEIYKEKYNYTGTEEQWLQDLINGRLGWDVATCGSEGIIYEWSSANGYYVVTGLGTCSDPDIIIPAQYKGKPVKEITANAFQNCSGLTSVTISNGLTHIRDYAFYNCSGLLSITLPQSLTYIGDSTFSGCTELTNCTIPDSVSSVGAAAFNGCTKLIRQTYYFDGYISYVDAWLVGCDTTIDTLSLRSNIKGIADYAFYNCTITDIIIPNGTMFIGRYAFASCKNLESIAIPESVLSIGNKAFDACSNLNTVHLTDIESWCQISFYNEFSNPFYYAKNLYLNGELVTDLIIPDGTTSIQAYAFYHCTTLTSVTIGNSVTYIGNSAFYGCSSLTSVTIGNSVIIIEESAFRYCSQLQDIVIPDSVTSIGSGAFSGCSGLVEITLPFVGGSKKTASDTYQYPFGYIFGTNSYTNGAKTHQSYYGSSTFITTNSTYYIPTGLQTVTITGGNILYGAFYNCSSLTSIHIPEGVASIGEWAFHNCSSLTSIHIPEGVTSIGEHAFYNCSSLTSIHIPDNMTFIGEYAFSGCENLLEEYDGVAYADKWVVACDSSISSPVFREGTRGIANIFRGKDNITSITIPNTVAYISDYAFTGCSNLQEVIIENGVTHIGEYAFRGCIGLTNITIPDSVVSIDERAFLGCTTLTSITFGTEGNGTISIGEYTFQTCTGLTDVTMSTSVVYIGLGAFWGCTGIKDLVVPDSVTYIGQFAFLHCDGLTNITLPLVGSEKDSRWSFGSVFGANNNNNAEYVPSSLKKVVITRAETTLHAGEFAYCNNLTSITIPNSVTHIGNAAFYNCTNLTSVYYQGSESEWNEISIGYNNDALKNATRYYYSETEQAGCWHYDTDGVTPVLW